MLVLKLSTMICEAYMSKIELYAEHITGEEYPDLTKGDEDVCRL